MFQWLKLKLKLGLKLGLKLFLLVSAMLVAGQLQTANAAPKAKLIKFWDDREESSNLKVDYSAWNEILEKYVVEGNSPDINRFNYAEVTEGDRVKLGSFLNYLQSMEPRQLNSLEQKAYWLNLFNAALIKEVIDKKVKRTVRALGSRLWRGNKLDISTQKTSLDDIEHGVLRPIFKDPRIHFSIVGGSVGSGEIQATAFTATNVEQMLEENAVKFINHPRGVLIENDEITISTIFKWYKTDFGENADEVRQYLLTYLEDDKKTVFESIQKMRYDYDWSINSPVIETSTDSEVSTPSNTSRKRAPGR